MPCSAQKVLNTDDEVDAFKNQIFRELLTYMMSDPGTIPRALRPDPDLAQPGARGRPRDRTSPEEVIYAAQGRDVRHHHEETKRTEEGK
jgi:phosphate transport system protein